MRKFSKKAATLVGEVLTKPQYAGPSGPACGGGATV